VQVKGGEILTVPNSNSTKPWLISTWISGRTSICRYKRSTIAFVAKCYWTDPFP
jgi:hypothetical protein